MQAGRRACIMITSSSQMVIDPAMTAFKVCAVPKVQICSYMFLTPITH